MALQKPYNIRQKTSTSDMSKYQMTVGQKKNILTERNIWQSQAQGGVAIYSSFSYIQH